MHCNPAAIESNTVFYLYGCHLLPTRLSAAARPIASGTPVRSSMMRRTMPAGWSRERILGGPGRVFRLRHRGCGARHRLDAAARFLVFADQDLRNARKPRGAPPLDF